MNEEFRRWPKIKRLVTTEMVITQKMDGTSAQIVFDDEGNFRAGSRNRWLTIEKDNFGFCEWVYDHSDELFYLLGSGRHYGEWCGPGIQSGEGLKEQTLFLFNHSFELPSEYEGVPVMPVPVLYKGPISMQEIEVALTILEAKGSKVNGFGNPEGIIVHIGGERFKVYMDQITEIENLIKGIL